MTRPAWCPQDLWEAAVRMQDELYHWTDESEAQDQDTLMFARALLAERERLEASVDKANSCMPGIETPLMRGDNLGITLCTHFDDGAESDDDTGWSPAAIAGYEEVTAAIRAHYAAAIRGAS